MRIVKVGVLAPTNKGIPLGVQGESCATEVEFDARPWFREYPSGTVSAVAKREGDPAPYPLSLDVADGTAVWLVSDTDTAKAGEGAVELTMTSGGTRVRSLTFKTLVTASLTDAPVDDDAWYGWLDKAVVKVDETVQAAQWKMAEVDEEWTGLKADVTAKVEECSEVAAQAVKDAHHAKVDAQAVAKLLDGAEGSVAKAEAAAKRAVDAALDADDSAVEASNSALSAGESAEAARSAWAGAVDAKDAAATSASAAAGSAEGAGVQKVAAENAKDAAESFKAGAEAAKGEAVKSAGDAAASADAAKKSAEDAAASAAAINVIAPKIVQTSANATTSNLSIGNGSTSIGGYGCVAVGNNSAANNESVSIGDGAKAASISASNAVAIGHNAKAVFTNSVALGALSTSSKVNEMSCGSSATDSIAEYTREITHVSAPTAASSAATKEYVDGINAISPVRLQYPPSSDGTSCIAFGRKAVSTGAGSVALGVNALAENEGVAIGDEAVSKGYGVALGHSSVANFASSSAIGERAVTSKINEVSFGRAATAKASEIRRELTHVALPTAPSSAATKDYVDGLVASANMVRGSSSILVENGTLKVNPAIFGDGLSVTDGQVSANMDYISEHLAGDALYYDQTDGLMLKVGQGLHIQNDELDIDQANLPLASAGVRGTVRVGSGLSIDADGVLSATGAGGAAGGYGKIAMTTLKTTERVNGIAGGEDDVAVDAAVPCAVGEMDGALSLTSAPAYRALRTTYTAGTVLHMEFEWLLDGVSLDSRMLVAAVLTVGNSSTLVPVTTRTVDGKLYKVVEFKATSDIKAGMFVSLKFF